MTTNQRTVLVVDSRPGVRALLRDCLGEAGFRVVESADPAGALERCARPDAAIDLLIADTFLSEVDAFQLAQEAHLRQPGMKAILLGAPHEMRRQEDIQVLARPFTIAALLRRVQHTLEPAPAARRSPAARAGRAATHPPG